MTTDAKGKQKRVYRRYLTPWEVFRNLPKAGRDLKPGQSLRALQLKGRAQSDTESARRMQEAKRILFADLHPAYSNPKKGPGTTTPPFRLILQ